MEERESCALGRKLRSMETAALMTGSRSSAVETCLITGRTTLSISLQTIVCRSGMGSAHAGHRVVKSVPHMVGSVVFGMYIDLLKLGKR